MLANFGRMAKIILDSTLKLAHPASPAAAMLASEAIEEWADEVFAEMGKARLCKQASKSASWS